ncbi:MAG: PD40 domain-containing protein [Nitrospirae bacterium]|nr:PD40 domain-containing protein [Nitrospirota bacterium]
MSYDENIGRKGNLLYWILALFFITVGAMALGTVQAEESKEVKADGKKLATLDPETFVPKSLVYSSDGRHAIWLIRSKDQYQLLVDGTPGPLFDGTYRTPVVLSPDGRRAAYVVENKKDHRLSVVSDGTIGPVFDKILPGTLIFSSDSRHIAYAGALQEKYQVLLDGAPSPDYELVGHLSFSPDGKRFVYAAQKDKRRFVVVDGVRGPSFDDVYPTGFSPDSRHIVYYATQGKKQRIMVDDHPGSEYDTIGPVRFNPAQGTEPPSIGYIALLGNDLIEVTQPSP